MTTLDKRKQLPERILFPNVGRWGRSVYTWVDERTGLGRPISAFFNYPVPLYVHRNVFYSLGGLTFITLSLQIITGILLSFYYDPSPQDAYNSVDYITYFLPLGWLVRGIHVYNASLIVLLSFLHMLRVFFYSAYKKPREITWLSGILMLLITLAFAFTGALLPWDQSAYWATKVGTEIAGTVPLIGGLIIRLLRGGETLGQATLSRFYILHIALLPTILILLIVLHVHQLRFHGVAPPLTQKGQAFAKRFIPFFPHWMVVDGTLGFFLLLLLIGFSYVRRPPLEFPADPTSTDFLPRPEWYFLFLFQLLKYFPGPLEPIATAVIPSVIIGSMLILPFIDKGGERLPWRKPVTTAVAMVYIAGIVLLTILAFLDG